ncbi:MAG: PQQ-like beta-propeller repeat protein [Planctomycetota bacterium]|jgi:outer membrane protein assembly factor BamB
MSNLRIIMGIGLAGWCSAVMANDWPSWRGPEQTGLSRETAPVTQWTEDGENMLWRVPIPGRSTPIYLDGRLFFIAPDGEGDTLRERIVSLDAETGKMIWSHTVNVFHTDIVENRLGWTSVAADKETRQLYVHTTGGILACFSWDGKVVWQHSLTEEFGRESGYGGRLHTPVIDEDRVIISFTYILSTWGSGKAKAGHRYLAFNKRDGSLEWIGQPGGKPYDTTYSTPVVTVVNGKRLLVGGNADGFIYGMEARTGKKVWSFHLTNRGGLNTSVVADGKYVYACHSNENVDTTEMGRVVCIDASMTGDITKTGEVWRAEGVKAGYSSPALANGRLYVVTNSANLVSLDATTGAMKWKHSLGRVMKGSPVVTSDGVIYAGEVNGMFYILKDEGDSCKVLDVDEFTRADGLVVEINGSVAVGDGRVFVMNADNTYCLGSTERPDKVDFTVPKRSAEAEADKANPATMLIHPAEVALAPGETANFTIHLYDANGAHLGTTSGDWSVNGVNGAMPSPGRFEAATTNQWSAGTVKATVGQLAASARVRVLPEVPFATSFDDMKIGSPPPGWIGLDVNTKIVEREGEVVLSKLAKSPSAKYSRMRSFSNEVMPVGYTVEADMMAMPRPQGRPVLSDMGLINSRYKMILLGREKVVRLVSYSPIPRVQVDVPFEWEGGVWYRAKMVVHVDGGSCQVSAKVWKRDEDEPSDWTATMDDPSPNHSGSPGLYAFSKGTKTTREGSLVFFDNYRVYRND